MNSQTLNNTQIFKNIIYIFKFLLLNKTMSTIAWILWSYDELI